MAIIGFNFTKMLAERKNAPTEKINISNNVSVQNVEEFQLKGKQKEKAAKFSYLFTSTYEPNVGKIEINGEIIWMDEEKQVKDLITSWKKDKKVPKEIMTDVLNAVLTRCNIESVVISRDINLPPPIPLPKVETKSTAEQYIG